MWSALQARGEVLLHEILDNTLFALTLPTKRIFLPFLLSGLVLATLVWAMRVRGRVSLGRFLFPREIWLHRSARLDYRLAIVRPLVHAAIFAPIALSVPAGAMAVARLLWNHVAILPRFEVSGATVMILFSVCAFVAEDLARFLVHRLAHRVPALWELHKVHHSAEVLTPLTIYRTHPIESFLMRSGAAVALILVAGVFTWLFPGRVQAMEIMGVYLLTFVWNLLGSNLRHSHVWLSYGPVLERIFISPAQHQVHHSVEPRHHHRNFGSALAVWDWMGGSLFVTRGREALQFGLPARSRNHEDRVLSVFFAPLGAIGRRFAARLSRG